MKKNPFAWWKRLLEFLLRLLRNLRKKLFGNKEYTVDAEFSPEELCKVCELIQPSMATEPRLRRAMLLVKEPKLRKIKVTATSVGAAEEALTALTRDIDEDKISPYLKEDDSFFWNWKVIIGLMQRSFQDVIRDIYEQVKNQGGNFTEAEWDEFLALLDVITEAYDLYDNGEVFIEGRVNIEKSGLRKVHQGPKNKDQKPGECKHSWLYGGGQMWCGLCGWYCQPDGRVTSSPGGRGGRILETITEDVITEAYDQASQAGLGSKGAEENIKIITHSFITDEKKINQSTLTAVANLVNNNGLLPLWGKGYTALKLSLLPDNSPLEAEFISPPGIKSGDFIQRFVDGKESLNGFLHRVPIIHLKISARVLGRMKERGELLQLIRSAVTYYDTGLNTVSDEMMSDIFRFGHVMKQLIVATPLVGIITLPLSCLLTFEKVGTGKDAFKIDDEMVKSYKRFVMMLSESPKATKEEQDKLVADLRETICKVSRQTTYGETVQSYQGLPEAIQALCEHGYDQLVGDISHRWLTEQSEPIIFTEATKVKRLKKIPVDLIAYITIEGEAIRDPNDKMMIVSYAYGKLEIVEWYIELIDVQTKRYIVPHTRDYLENIRRQLLAAIKKIMDRPVPNPSDPVVSIQYPKGYEG